VNLKEPIGANSIESTFTHLSKMYSMEEFASQKINMENTFLSASGR
jgi:hypothetical protein